MNREAGTIVVARQRSSGIHGIDGTRMSHRVSKSHLSFRGKPDHDGMIDACDRQHVGHDMVRREHSDRAWRRTEGAI